MRGRSRRKKRTGKMVSLQKRFLAFMLAFAMIFTNVGTDLHVSFAASGNKVDFTIGGADLVDAIRQAIEDENVVSQDSLDFTDGATEKFEALFFGDGKVYEVYPDIQGDSMEAELRVFVKLPADADDTYMVTGEEEVYFLYVNNGEDTISCTTEITRMDDGVEKVKKYFPPQVTGAMIAVIGLNLLPTAFDMASNNIMIAMITLAIALIINNFGKGFIKQLGILIAVIIYIKLSIRSGRYNYYSTS